MSIPKQPRQLMINIMYLVLTALLALNVSAEIFNAFKVVDEGLKNANDGLTESNAALPAIINDRAKKTKELAQYADRTGPAQQYSKELTDWIDDEIIGYMIDKTGDDDGTPYSDGDYDEYKGVRTIKGQKNKDITTKYLVTGDKQTGTAPKGAELKQRIEDTRQKFLTLIDEEDRARFEANMPLAIDDETWRNSIDKSKKTWEDFNFRQMPLGATLPIFRKFINDTKATEAAVLNYLMGKVGGEDIVLDQFKVVSSPKKTYVINGERFETEVFLSAAASKESNTDITIKVNGANMQVDEEGAAQFSQTASGVGIKKYRAEISVRNPVTNELDTYEGEFEYEVGERSVSVSATKMNVFYMGVPNPVEVSAAGVASGDVRVSMSGAGGGSISKNADGTYTVQVSGPPTKVGEFASINVNAPGLEASKQFRVKRIPNPVAKLSTKVGGAMSTGEFKAQGGVSAVLENFDFDARCEIIGFQLVRVAPRSDPEFATNGGARYSGDSRRIVDKARPGDRYFFENVKAKCPGDKAGREINSMVFNIR